MDAEEFELWLAYREVQPFGPMQLMPVLAELLAATANGALMRKDKQMWRAGDFIDVKRWQAPPVTHSSEPGAKPSAEDVAGRLGF